jgi:MFS family permease
MTDVIPTAAPTARAAPPDELLDEAAAPHDVLRTGAGIVLLSGTLLSGYAFGEGIIVLPSISARLQLGPDVTGLVVATFSLGFAMLLVFGGRLGDRHGRRRVFRIGLAALVVTSLAVAVAPGILVLLIARLAQGAAAGLMLPQVLATLQHASAGHHRARWLAANAAATGSGTVVGQLLGGGLGSLDLPGGGWRWAFGVIAVIAAAVLAASPLVPETRSTHGAGTDGVGAILFGAGIGAILLPIATGRQFGWPWWSFVLLAAGIGLLAAFVVWERRVDPARALMPPIVLRVPALTAGIALALLFFVSYSAFVSATAFAFEAGLGRSPLEVAEILAPFGLAFVVASLFVPRMLRRFDAVATIRLAAVAQGALLIGIALVVHGQWDQLAQWEVQPLLVALGVAQAFLFGPLLRTVMGSIPGALAGLSSGLFSTAQQLGTAIGVALFGLLAASLPAAPGTAFLVGVLVEAGLSVVFIAMIGVVRRSPV